MVLYRRQAGALGLLFTRQLRKTEINPAAQLGNVNNLARVVSKVFNHVPDRIQSGDPEALNGIFRLERLRRELREHAARCIHLPAQMRCEYFAGNRALLAELLVAAPHVRGSSDPSHDPLSRVARKV